jgi:hypothetical protein
MYMDFVRNHLLKKLKFKNSSSNEFKYYQLLSSSQKVYYVDEEVPMAKFTYDFSPMVIEVRNNQMEWYTYVTKLFAILGGTYTVFQILDKFVYSFNKKTL